MSAEILTSKTSEFQYPFKHGHNRRGSATRTYTIWKLMRQRCVNKKGPGFKNYGGRGIKVCERWGIYSNFLSDMGEAPDGMSIDRFPDNNGNYCPENCRWATQKQQCLNTRRNVRLSFLGKTQTIREWATELGINMHSLYYRLESGWPIEVALTKPFKKRTCEPCS